MISAHTKYPNTPESDMQSVVWHVVEYTDDDGNPQTREVLATDPMEAIEKVRGKA